MNKYSALLAAIFVSACSRDLGLEAKKFACTTDSDCIRDTVCDPVTNICVDPGELTDAGPSTRDAAPDDADAGEPRDAALRPDARPRDAEPEDSGASLQLTWGTETSTRAEWWLYTHQTAAQLEEKLALHNARILDLDLETAGAEWIYSAVLIENTGAFAADWKWVSDVVNLPGAGSPIANYRPVNVELALTGTVVHYSVVGINNQGPARSGWAWYTQEHGRGNIDAYLESRSYRVLDIDLWDDGGDALAVVMVPRAGLETSWAPDLSVPDLEALLATGVSLSAMAYEPDTGRFTVATTACPCLRGGMIVHAGESELRARVEASGMRIERIEHYLRNGVETYSAILIDNGR